MAIIKKDITIKSQEVIDIICDLCGESCLDELGINFEYATLKSNWGYGSNKDGEKHEVHLCENCYDRITKHFNINIKITGLDYTLINI